MGCQLLDNSYYVVQYILDLHMYKLLSLEKIQLDLLGLVVRYRMLCNQTKLSHI